jgi:Ca2+-dependent lipid-binding protein
LICALTDIPSAESGIIIFNIIGGNFAKKSRLEVMLDDSSWPVVVTPKGRSVHAKFNMISEGFVKELDFGQIWFKLDESDNDEKDVIYAELKLDTKVFLEQCLVSKGIYSLFMISTLLLGWTFHPYTYRPGWREC